MDDEQTGGKRARLTPEERLRRQQEAQKAALERYRQRSAMVSKLKGQQRQRERKLDTRRKIIAGGLALAHMERDATFAAMFRPVLDRFVTGLPERELFEKQLTAITGQAVAAEKEREL